MNIIAHNGNPFEGSPTLKEKPRKPKFFMRLVVAILAYPPLIIRGHRFIKKNMKKIKHPYILLVNHNSYLDYRIAAKAVLPHPASNVVALEGFIGLEKPMHWIGGIGRRKFTHDITFIRHVLHVLRNYKNSLIMYPEARYSLVGTPSKLPDGLGKLIKVAKVPVVTLINHGNHLAQPYWHPYKRFVRPKSYLTQIITQEEIEQLSVQEINRRVHQAFQYDDYLWQQKNNVKIAHKKRAEGLHRVLYQCPSCFQENQMVSEGANLICKACDTQVTLSEYGVLTALDKDPIFTHIPDWFEWQRTQVRQEIIDKKFSIATPVKVYALPNSKGFIPLENGFLEYDYQSIKLSYTFNNETFIETIDARKQQAIHIEFDYLNQGQAMSFSTDSQTYFIFIDAAVVPVTKLYLVAEESHLELCQTNKIKTSSRS